jgi:hypothetical protein
MMVTAASANFTGIAGLARNAPRGLQRCEDSMIRATPDRD